MFSVWLLMLLVCFKGLWFYKYLLGLVLIVFVCLVGFKGFCYFIQSF